MTRTLEAIAGMKLVEGDSLSEAALAIGLVSGSDTRASRGAIREAFCVLADIGVLSPVFDAKGRRTTTLWRVHEAFGKGDVAHVVGWRGRNEEEVR